MPPVEQAEVDEPTWEWVLGKVFSACKYSGHGECKMIKAKPPKSDGRLIRVLLCDCECHEEMPGVKFWDPGVIDPARWVQPGGGLVQSPPFAPTPLNPGNPLIGSPWGQPATSGQITIDTTSKPLASNAVARSNHTSEIVVDVQVNNMALDAAAFAVSELISRQLRTKRLGKN